MEREWFDHPEWWFAGCDAVDRHVADRFEHLLDRVDHSGIEAILVYDQLPRHVYRGQPCAHVIEYFLRKALAVRLDLESLDDDRFCFALLPSRHAGNWREALEKAWSRVDARGEASPSLRRFLKATYDRAPRDAGCFSESPETVDRAILEHSPVLPPADGERIEAPEGRVVVSLSGGVDSMLCSWMLRGRLHSTVHVNYCNRCTSDREADLVAWWSRNVLGVPCVVRRIDEIRRVPCMAHGLRETYEKYTRDVRYECYRAFGRDALIVLGHNRDDALENVFTNVAKGCASLENLRGMRERSTVDGIEFWRPFLNLSKSEICEKARAMRIPYLPTSTPAWSMRGQIRSSIVPALDAWNPRFVENLYALSGIVANLCASLDERARSSGFIADADARCAIFWRRWLDARGYRASAKSIEYLCDRLRSSRRLARVVLSKSLTLELEHSGNGWRCAENHIKLTGIL